MLINIHIIKCSYLSILRPRMYKFMLNVIFYYVINVYNKL
jgi:hypothetical protein